MDLFHYAMMKKIGGGSGGGSSGGGEEGFNDGKTRLFIEIAEEGRMDISVCIYQSVENGVTIDWGDGSAPETFSGSGHIEVTHTYARIGEYIIAFDVVEGCTFGLGNGSSSSSFMGTITMNKCRLKKAELGNGMSGINSYAYQKFYALTSVKILDGVTSIGDYAFQYCYALTSVEISNGVKNIRPYAFQYCYALEKIEIPNGVKNIWGDTFRCCYALSSVKIPNSVTDISSNAFRSCTSLTKIEFPNSVKSIYSGAFQDCSNIKVCDFTSHTSVPTLGSANVFNDIPADCEIRVPMALVDAWKSATNWSNYEANIVGV